MITTFSNLMNLSYKLQIILFIVIIIIGIFYNFQNYQVDRNNSNSDDSDKINYYSYSIINSYPHDTEAFTQGLVIDEGILYEGTGIKGESTIRKIDLESGEILHNHDLDPKYFGEGVTIFENNIIQLTWKSKIGFVYDKTTFELIRTFNYSTEGWGITHDNSNLIMSDGTEMLYFLDPDTYEVFDQIKIMDRNKPLTNLNELEYINGEIYANVWQTDMIARISPQSGKVVGWINLSGLVEYSNPDITIDVLNGIAYDADSERLFVTGKLWPEIFEIKLVLE